MKSGLTLLDEKEFVACDTLFYQGNGSSQTQVLKYTPEKLIATTGETMWSTGRNHFPPLQLIYRPFIGKEISDINLNPFISYFSYLNPLTVAGSLVTWVSNWRNGFHFTKPFDAAPESVKFHAPILSNVSIGQATDIQSHQEKYKLWLKKADKTNSLILWGVSRGTAATFSAFAEHQYPEVKLVVLEGAIDSVQEVIAKRVANIFKYDYISRKVTDAIYSGFSFFHRINILNYNPQGPSPLKSVTNFPENIPVIFITSKIDKTVPCSNTENIATALAKKGKNDVYLLKLNNSSHPNYMFDDETDRTLYQNFIHAIYKKYHLSHDAKLAENGHQLIEKYHLCDSQVQDEKPLEIVFKQC